WDDLAVQAARAGLAGTDLPLTVDANGAYQWPGDERALRALDAAGLLYIEQPLAPEELVGHARLARALHTPLCLDETLRDAGIARQIVALEGPLVWNIKVHRIGGLTEACRIYRVAAECGARLWAGTMPESGIGSQAGIAVAALPSCVYPPDLEPSARWFGRGVDVVKLTMSKDGRLIGPGVWRSRDYGRTWTPIFDDQPTGSIGAIAVAPSDPRTIYVGSGEGLQRPDLSVGDGVFKSTDGGTTWRHVGLADGLQIPAIVVDPRDPNRVFVAVLGHPYGPSVERGVYRSLD